MLNSNQFDNKLGEDYIYIDGISQYLAGLRTTDGEEKVNAVIEDLKNTPVAYGKFLENMLLTPESPLRVQERANMRFSVDVAKKIMRGQMELDQLIKICTREDAYNSFVLGDPAFSEFEFSEKSGGKIMEETEAEVLEGRENGNFRIVREYEPKTYEEAMKDLDKELRREAFEKQREKKTTDTNYKTFMKRLKKSDPAEYKRTVALHKQYKSENKKLEKLMNKCEKLEILNEKYSIKDANGLLTAKEDAAWSKLIKDMSKAYDARNDFQKALYAKNEARYEKGMITECQKVMRKFQIRECDTVSLPMTTLEQTVAARQTSFCNSREKYALLETDVLNASDRTKPQRAEVADTARQAPDKKIVDFDREGKGLSKNVQKPFDGISFEQAEKNEEELTLDEELK